ncbi:nucleotide exchange factor GrpE [Elstera cyanobacteriorum]|uniref:Protein GrpE n=1 Tax=Elstera cyanobacteriorum TaxID=2022747 RepID=A0A255XM25_9PROT|nr:nucleotide exchange factor GrpE [Elstera cyanobacteriorum]MCK6441322.1 nucleotide exchange factor GrpE [Elstera cyanobacteriorum]OYQ18006.1 nucleotide exchange factor GrpE [Elstera cyanobacteriorum]GFZ84514.1 protein GrpE [Elstera cyanobacteriorum]
MSDTTESPETVAETETIPTGDQQPHPADVIAALQAEIAGLKDQALRALAEAENTRRRAERDREDASKYAVSSFARDLLSVADNLRRALDAVPPSEDETVKALVTGVEATERELLAVFDRRGLTRIEPMGQTFDPNFHEAVFEVPNTGQPTGTVVQVLQVGYRIHDRLLRPAMVGVAKGDAGAQVNTSA